MKINEVIIERLDARDDLQLARMNDLERAEKAGKLPANDQITTLIGPNSPSWNPDSNSQAAELEKQKVSPIEIWKKTGNWRGPEGEWRQEIPDNEIKIKKEFKGTGRLGDFIDHPDLEKAYPGIMDMELKFYPDSGDNMWAGYWSPSQKRIGISLGSKEKGYQPTIDDILGTLSHEWQHVIQDLYEPGFTQGAHPDMKKMQDISKNITKHNKQAGGEEFTSTHAYDSTGGERTAELVKDRLYYTPIERQEIYPGRHYYGQAVTIPGTKVPDNAHGTNIQRKDGDLGAAPSVTTKHSPFKNYDWHDKKYKSTTYNSQDGKYSWE